MFNNYLLLQDAIEQTGLEPRSGEVVANVAAEVSVAQTVIVSNILIMIRWEQRPALMMQ